MSDIQPEPTDTIVQLIPSLSTPHRPTHNEIDWKAISDSMDEFARSFNTPVDLPPIPPHTIQGGPVYLLQMLIASVFSCISIDVLKTRLPNAESIASLRRFIRDILVRPDLRLRVLHERVLDVVDAIEGGDFAKAFDLTRPYAKARKEKIAELQKLVGELEKMVRTPQASQQHIQLAIEGIKAASYFGLPVFFLVLTILKGNLHLTLRPTDSAGQSLAAHSDFERAAQMSSMLRRSNGVYHYDAGLDVEACRLLSMTWFYRRQGDPMTNNLASILYASFAFRQSCEVVATTEEDQRALDHKRAVTAKNVLLAFRQIDIGKEEFKLHRIRRRLICFKLIYVILYFNDKHPTEDVEDVAFSVLAVCDTMLRLKREDRTAAGWFTYAAIRKLIENLLDRQEGIKNNALLAQLHFCFARWTLFEVSAIETTSGTNSDSALAVTVNAEKERLRRLSLEQLRSALSFAIQSPDRNDVGCIHLNILLVLGALNDEIESWCSLRGLQIADIDDMPRTDAGRLGALIAHMHARGKQWLEATRYYGVVIRLQNRLALEATHEVTRRSMYVEYSRSFRWGSVCAAQAGELETAMLFLEQGRAREVRTRIVLAEAGVEQPLLNLEGDLDVPRALAIVNSRSASKVRYSSIDEARLASVQDLKDATTSTWPLVFINPTPYGTSILSRDHAGHYQHLIAPGYTSRQACFDQLYFGLKKSKWDVGASQLRDWMKRLGEHLGPAISEVLNQLKTAGEVEGLTVIPCGPLVGAPLAAMEWQDGEGNTRYFLDIVACRYAPSAFVLGRCLEKAKVAEESIKTCGRPSLLALGDPASSRGRLPSSIRECRVVAKMFRGASRVFTRKEATAARLRSEIEHVSHLLIAAHGSSKVFKRGTAGMHLADGFLSAHEVPQKFQTDHGPLDMKARLAMLSLCDTASSHFDLPDELLSVPTVFLIVGFPATVASLWKLHDTAAALLSVKMFDLHINHRSAGQSSLAPALALQQAQRWLRDLSINDNDKLFERYPHIGELFEDYLDEEGVDIEKPFGHPMYWAPWVCYGA